MHRGRKCPWFQTTHAFLEYLGNYDNVRAFNIYAQFLRGGLMARLLLMTKKNALSVGLAVSALVSGAGIARAFFSTPAHAQAMSTIEPTVASLDAAWEKRAELHPVIVAFLKSKPKLPDNFEVLFRVARIGYYGGFFALPKDSTDEEKMDLFKYATDASERARKLDSKRVEGHYWYAVNLGGWGIAKGIRASLGSADGMRLALDEAIKIDPKYHFAGPYRVRGRLFFKLPGGFISFGDNKKALEDLRKALELAPDSKLNYAYMAEIQNKVENKQAALKTVEAAKNLPDVVGVAEEAAYRRELGELEKKFR